MAPFQPRADIEITSNRSEQVLWASPHRPKGVTSHSLICIMLQSLDHRCPTRHVVGTQCVAYPQHFQTAFLREKQGRLNGKIKVQMANFLYFIWYITVIKMLVEWYISKGNDKNRFKIVIYGFEIWLKFWCWGYATGHVEGTQRLGLVSVEGTHRIKSDFGALLMILFFITYCPPPTTGVQVVNY